MLVLGGRRGREEGRGEQGGCGGCEEALTTPTPRQRGDLQGLSHDGGGDFVPQCPHGITGGTFGEGEKG